jgi:hypothetical protein
MDVDYTALFRGLYWFELRKTVCWLKNKHKGIIKKLRTETDVWFVIDTSMANQLKLMLPNGSVQLRLERFSLSFDYSTSIIYYYTLNCGLRELQIQSKYIERWIYNSWINWSRRLYIRMIKTTNMKAHTYRS